MNRLREVQRNFAGFVWGEAGPSLAEILSTGLAPEQRLAVYRNNTLLGLTEAMRLVYPVIARLVGENCFNGLCRQYIPKYPPRTGCLLTFGGRFPEFLAECRTVAALPYLPDTAKLEWFRHEAYYESDDLGIGPADLNNIPEYNYGKLKFDLHPAVRFLISPYPVQRIWESNQPDYCGDNRITFEEGGSCLLVFRSGWEVEAAPLDRSQFRFLTALRSGRCLNQAAADVLADNPAFDIVNMLQLCLSHSIFNHYSLV